MVRPGGGLRQALQDGGEAGERLHRAPGTRGAQLHARLSVTARSIRRRHPCGKSDHKGLPAGGLVGRKDLGSGMIGISEASRMGETFIDRFACTAGLTTPSVFAETPCLSKAGSRPLISDALAVDTPRTTKAIATAEFRMSPHPRYGQAWSECGKTWAAWL